MDKQSIKYTTDGKKVVVVGDLNQAEKIVQEIYVTNDGCEIPQGEHFVVSSLLDSPAKSWKDKKLEELEQVYEKESQRWELKTDQLIKEKESLYKALSHRVKWLRGVAKEPEMKSLNKALNTIADFMDGSEKWVLLDNWDGYILEKFNDDGISIIDNKIGDSYDYRYNSMRLLSLFGESDGSFDFRISRYSNGTGSEEKVLFFKSKEEALRYIQNKLDNKSEYTDRDLKDIDNFSLKFDIGKYNKYQDKLIEYSLKHIEELETSLSKEREQCKELKNNLI